MSLATDFLRLLTAPARAGFKALRFTGQTASWSTALLPRTKYNYAREVGDGRGSSVVMAPINWMARTFPEAPVQVSQPVDEGGDLEPVTPHPMVELIERPNPFYSGVVLWMATISDYGLDGNAYWLKLRGPDNRVVQLWYAPAWTMTPKWPLSGAEYISHYEYKPDDSRAPDKIDPADVVHFRWGLDPKNVRKGLSPLKSLFREIFTDDEAANFSASLLRNMGVAGVMLSPKGDDSGGGGLSDADAEETKDVWGAKFSGDKRGEPLVMKVPMNVQVMSFTPEQMALKLARRIPEERVSAVLGIPAAVVGLGSGLEQTKVGATMAELREMAYESNIVPTQRLMSADLQVQLLPDFADEGRQRVGFDLTNVRVLQDDRFKVWERATDSVGKGALMVSEFKRMIGVATDDSEDYYLRPFTTQAVPLAVAGETTPALTPSQVREEQEPGTATGLKAARPGARQYQVQMELVRQAQARLMRPRLEAFFAAQAARVSRRITRLASAVPAGGNGRGMKHHLPGADELLPASELTDLQGVMQPGQLSGVESGWSTTADAWGLGSAFDVSNPFVLDEISGAATRITAVYDTTKEAVRGLVVTAEERGYNAFQLARGVPEDGFLGIDSVVRETYLNRSQAIARTEAMWTTNKGAVALYRSEGISRVQMIDGRDDDVCSNRDGREVTLAEGNAEVDFEHPNGTLVLAPIIGRGRAPAGGEPAPEEPLLSGEAKRLSVLQKEALATRFRATERALVVDEAGNVVLTKSGGKSSVRFTQTEVNTVRAAKRPSFTHNHPHIEELESVTFSLADALFASNTRVIEMRATTHLHTHILRSAEGQEWPLIPELRRAYQSQAESLRASYVKRVSEGTLQNFEANMQIQHEIWTTLTAPGGELSGRVVYVREAAL